MIIFCTYQFDPTRARWTVIEDIGVYQKGLFLALVCLNFCMPFYFVNGLIHPAPKALCTLIKLHVN